MLRVDIVTNAPTPYNAALFCELSRITDLRVHFESPASTLRQGLGDSLDGYEAVVHRGIRFADWGTWSPRLTRSLRRDAEVVIVGGTYTSPTIAGLLLAKACEAERVFWGERFRRESPELDAVRRFMFRRTDMVLAVGDRAGSQYRKVTNGPVSVLPYACRAGEWLQHGSRHRIGFIGQLIPRKGVDLLFEACQVAGIRGIDIVGMGRLDDELRRGARSLGLDVRWYGERRNSELGAIREEWAYQVVPSRYDGWGVVVNEALASGVPVVVSNAVGAAELVHEGENGWIHEAGSATSLAASLDRAREESGNQRVRAWARAVGEAFTVGPAAEFAVDVLAEPGVERSFVEEQWIVATRNLGDSSASEP